MSQYELLYIVPTRFTEDELTPIKQKVRESIEQEGGKIFLDDSLGKKKLAYPIKKFHQGYYLLNHFELNGANLESLEKKLRLTDEIIRHIVVKYEPKTAMKIEKIKEGISDIPKFREPEDMPKKKEEPKEIKPEAEKIKLEELDKKLDEILKTDNLL